MWMPAVARGSPRRARLRRNPALCSPAVTHPRRLAVITGASRGIGLSITRALAPSCDLVLVARTTEGLDLAVADAERLGAKATPLAAALDDAASTQALAQQLVGMNVDVLVCNAGVAPSASLAKTDEAMWRQTLAVNLDAPFVLCRALVPGMVARRWGRVVSVASTAALKGYRYTAAYSASKAGLVGLMRAVASETSGSGVTVNAVCPGFVDTDIVTDAVNKVSRITGKDVDVARADFARFSPQGRLVQPDEVASLVAYLVSEGAAAIHGQAIAQDGGETSL